MRELQIMVLSYSSWCFKYGSEYDKEKSKKLRHEIFELKALRKDAAQLDWLDRELATPLNLFDGRSINIEEQGLRFTIEAAMKGQP